MDGWRAGAAVALALSCAVAARARADDRPPVRLRASVGGGYVVSADQHARLGLDLPVLDAWLDAGWVATDFLVLGVALSGDVFFSREQSPGGLLDATVGAELRADTSPARPWLSVHAGAGATGALVRPVLRIAAGIDLRATPELTLGPSMAYLQVFQQDGPGFTDDAQLITVSLTLTYRPSGPRPPAAAVPRRAGVPAAGRRRCPRLSRRPS